MKRIICALAAVFCFTATAQAIVNTELQSKLDDSWVNPGTQTTVNKVDTTEAQICSIYFDTMSECNTARSKESSGSVLSACTYTAGSGYQWCIESRASGNLLVEECAYNTAAECKAVAAHGTCTKASTGCYYPTSCSNGYYQNTELKMTFNGTDVEVPTCMACPENGTCNGTSITCNSGYKLSSTNPDSSSVKTLRGTKWCVPSSGIDLPVITPDLNINTISDSCPSGLSKSADGCCCVK